MKLTIGICTIPKRQPLLTRLLKVLEPQLTSDVQLLIDEGEGVIGAKRQRQLAKADGEYVCWIDDDDLVSADYVQQILSAPFDVDCIGFKVRRFNDGKESGYAVHSMIAKRYWQERVGNTIRYWRTPNHLNPIKTGLALATGYKAFRDGEDCDYARRIYPVLQTEHFINSFLYTYLWQSKRNRLENIR